MVGGSPNTSDCSGSWVFETSTPLVRSIPSTSDSDVVGDDMIVMRMDELKQTRLEG